MTQDKENINKKVTKKNKDTKNKRNIKSNNLLNNNNNKDYTTKTRNKNKSSKVVNNENINMSRVEDNKEGERNKSEIGRHPIGTNVRTQGCSNFREHCNTATSDSGSIGRNVEVERVVEESGSESATGVFSSFPVTAHIINPKAIMKFEGGSRSKGGCVEDGSSRVVARGGGPRCGGNDGGGNISGSRVRWDDNEAYSSGSSSNNKERYRRRRRGGSASYEEDIQAWKGEVGNVKQETSAGGVESRTGCDCTGINNLMNRFGDSGLIEDDNGGEGDDADNDEKELSKNTRVIEGILCMVSLSLFLYFNNVCFINTFSQ